MGGAAGIRPERAGKILKHCAREDVGLVKRAMHRHPQTGHTFLCFGAPDQIVPNTAVIPEAEERKKDKTRPGKAAST
jgi:hypothetical protein